MIAYDQGTWGVWFIFQIKGSVFPKAACWATSSSVLAVLVKLFLFSWHDTEYMDGVDTIWSSYTFVLGFLIVFRNNQAYSRFWEGTSLTKQMRGQWFSALSGLFAFCSRNESKCAEVERFQKNMVRLASLLHCSALQHVCCLEDDSLEIINSGEMDAASMEFLRSCANPHEVVVNWVQRLIVQAMDSGTIDIPPPILSRTFQEIGNGVVYVENARKIKDVPFPFPYAQMISCMLLLHWLFTPILAAHYCGSAAWAGVMSFFVTISFWSLFYIALELDQPFGEDPNDLPIQKMQQDWNSSLLVLLLPCAQVVPTFSEPRGGNAPDSPKPLQRGLGQLFKQHKGPRMSLRRGFTDSASFACWVAESLHLERSPTKEFDCPVEQDHSPTKEFVHDDCPVEKDHQGSLVITETTEVQFSQDCETGEVPARSTDDLNTGKQTDKLKRRVSNGSPQPSFSTKTSSISLESFPSSSSISPRSVSEGHGPESARGRLSVTGCPAAAHMGDCHCDRIGVECVSTAPSHSEKSLELDEVHAPGGEGSLGRDSFPEGGMVYI
ncbi:unnamed protein product [Polarella glacialis]|uniref:Bestrophin homolog n=1 Tax=Polarella glacialis TaxID=89957 RepID=A0A813DY39_POLGL|nr:unnamed protein product [Polarella glacialis]